MKISIFFVSFSTLLFISLAHNENFISKKLSNDKRLSNYICNVTRNIIESKTDTQDVLVKNLGGEIWSSEINDIVGCIEDVSAVIVNDFDKVLTRVTLRKATVIILMMNIVTTVSKVYFKL